MSRFLHAALRALLGAILLLSITTARADTPVALFQSFSGNLNFTGTVATQRSSATNVCSVYSASTTITKALSGIPAGATVVAAHLYWAGSGSTPDYTVTFQNTTINAQRKYTGTYSDGTNTYSYFGGAADVTSIVAAKGNGNYSFSGLSVTAGSPYCDVEGVLAGFALMVVYSDPTQPFRVLNIYEGFQFTRNSSIPLTLSNFKVPNPLGTNTGRIGHITWEGDESLNQQGENLSFNSNVLTDAINPSGNQFNSKSNINGDQASYGIDFDAYTIGSPIIMAGDTSATTTYASGQDLVWLNVEIVAVPNIPTSDLAITMTRAGDPSPGAVLSYTLNVKNNGPYQDPGPVTVTNTLPSGMTYSGASGTGWSCTTSGATATCIYNGAVAVGQSMPPITVGVVVDTSGTYTTFTNTATVDVGQNVFDNQQANNSATDTSTDDTMVGADYVFTIGACAAGKAIGATGSGCQRFVGPLLAATDQQLYITGIQNGVATQPKKTTVNMRFSLSCVNPVANAGVRAQFAGQTLPLCTANGAVPPTSNNTAWSADVSINFPGTSPSGRISSTGVAPILNYADVGLVQLNLWDRDNKGSLTGLARFVSAPAVTFSQISNAPESASNDGVNAFAVAGELFNVKIKVADKNGNFPPNFGKEAAPYGPVTVMIGAPDPSKISPTAPVFTGPLSGVFSTQIAYSDLGMIDKLTATTVGQGGLGTGTYLGAVLASGQSSDSKTVGYFYPAYFNTTASAPIACIAPMACPQGNAPTGEPLQIDTAAYSGQPFKVSVLAFSKTNVDVTAQLGSIPAFTISLDAFNAPGGSTATGTAENKTLASTAAGVKTELVDVLLAVPCPPATTSCAFDFNNPRAITSWAKPASAYMRATAQFARRGTSGVQVTSQRAAGLSREGGVRIVAGRLMVGNANGSELLRMPLYLIAQYWTGSAWVNNPNDNDSTVSNSINLTSCQLRTGTTTCTPFKLEKDGIPVPLSGGQATTWLSAPGAGNAGSVRIDFKNMKWLPSTRAIAVFGTFKSPTIYLREVY